MLRARLTIFCMLMLSSSAFAAGVDIAADTISSDPGGVITAEGDVVIQRQDETLKADQVIYDAENRELKANGHVVIESENGTIEAESARMHTVDKTGEMEQAKVTLKGGERISAEHVRRVSGSVMTAEDVTFTSCPADAEAWSMRAASAELDQQEGTLSARHARLEIGSIPVFYTPFWNQVLRRKSGFLLPFVSVGRVRGTEIALPFYLAPADNWDVTLTPHWMTARGMMGEAEFRQVSTSGYVTLQAEGLNDKKSSTQRSRLQADIEERLPLDIRLSAHADHLSDTRYLAEFGTDNADTSSRYMQSYASLSQGFDYGDWSLLVNHQQDLQATSNASTLQILPRFQSGIYFPMFGENAIFHFDQQSTQFQRTLGIHGIRVDLNPYLEIPFLLAGGGFQSTLQVGGRHTRYWLKDVGVQTVMSRNTFEASLENRIYFERVSESRKWRHAITPILRYDYINAPDQSQLPNFDSSFGKLSMDNLLTGNRFSGYDRIERLNRISFLIETELQHKSEAGEAALSALTVRAGAAYELKRESVDPALLAAQTHPFSNLLGEIIINPVAAASLTASGQYDPVGHYWAKSQAGINIGPGAQGHLKIDWQRTDARYTTPSELVSSSAEIQAGRRFSLLASWDYDLLVRQTQQASAGFKYTHPCWDISLEGYRYRLNGTNVTSDIGMRLLIGLKGLGSVGS